MFSVKRGNWFQLAAISYFILGNLFFGLMIGLLQLEIGIVGSLIVSQLLLVGGALLFYKFKTHANWRNDFYIKPLPWLEVFICVGIAWCIMPLLSFINVVSQFFVQNEIQDALQGMIELPFLLTLFMTGVLPAVLEELLTRATILRNYQKKTVMIACLTSGMFFGFIHLNINQFLYAFIMGAIMSYIVMTTGSIVSSMVIHFIINATGITALYVITAFMKLFDDSGLLLSEMMSTATPTTGQLLISATMMLFMAAFFTPVAGLLIQQLLKRHGKTFKGSLKMHANDFIAIETGNTDESFSANIDSAEDANDYVPEIPEEKVWTTPLILTAILFVLFALFLEFSSRFMGA